MPAAGVVATDLVAEEDPNGGLVLHAREHDLGRELLELRPEKTQAIVQRESPVRTLSCGGGRVLVCFSLPATVQPDPALVHACGRHLDARWDAVREELVAGRAGGDCEVEPLVLGRDIAAVCTARTRRSVRAQVEYQTASDRRE